MSRLLALIVIGLLFASITYVKAARDFDSSGKPPTCSVCQKSDRGFWLKTLDGDLICRRCWDVVYEQPAQPDE